MEAIRVLLKDVVAGAAVPLTGAASDYDALLDLVGSSRFVLLGEASHAATATSILPNTRSRQCVSR